MWCSSGLWTLHCLGLGPFPPCVTAGRLLNVYTARHHSWTAYTCDREFQYFCHSSVLVYLNLVHKEQVALSVQPSLANGPNLAFSSYSCLMGLHLPKKKDWREREYNSLCLLLPLPHSVACSSVVSTHGSPCLLWSVPCSAHDSPACENDTEAMHIACALPTGFCRFTPMPEH